MNNNNSDEKIQKGLIDKYNYCSHIVWVDNENTNPLYFTGSLPACDKDNHIINHVAQCSKCPDFPAGVKTTCYDCSDQCQHCC